MKIAQQHAAIEAVQVYGRGATVVRTITVDGRPEALEIIDLPLSLIDATVQVRVRGAAHVRCRSHHVGIYVRPAPTAHDAPEQREIDDLRRGLDAIADELALFDEELGLLESLPVPERPVVDTDRAPPPAPLASRLALARFGDETARGLRERRRALQQRQREQRRILEDAVARLEAATTAHAAKRSDLSKSVTVGFAWTDDADGPERFTLELRYIVPGARWAPAYQVRLKRDGSAASLQLRAHIAQATGEDWRGVRVSVSTAAPLRFSTLPELASIRIGRAQSPPPARGFRPAPRGGESLFADLDQAQRRLLDAPRLFPVFDGVHLPTPAQTFRHAAGPMPARRRAPPAASSGGGARAQGVLDDPGTSEADVLLDDDFDDDSALPLEMPLEMKMAMSAPPPPPSAPAPMMSRAAPAAPMPRRAAKRAGPRLREQASETGPGAGASDVPDDVVAALTFHLLRLPPPTDRRRGRLQPVNDEERYATSAARTGRPLAVSLAQAIHDAEVAAGEAGGVLPAMCIDPNDIGSRFDFTYDADGLVDVDGDGGWHSVPLSERTCEASVRYVAVPRLESHVYRVAVLQNPLTAPLLVGPAELYVGDEYVLTTALPMVAGKGEFTLGLGVEQAIKVARNARFNEVRNGTGVVAMVDLVHDIEIDVVNHLGRAIDLEVRERIPVPHPGAEVQVDERDVSPAWEVWHQEDRGPRIDGGRRWQVRVDAGAAQQLKARYVLKLFSNAEVAGGNRRES